MRLSLALVAAGDDEHGDSKHDTHTDGACSNAYSGGSLFRRLAALISRGKRIVIGAWATRRGSALGWHTTNLDVTVDIDVGINESCDVSH